MKETLSLAADVATAVGVLIAVWQLKAAHAQSVTAFEDSFVREYREVIAKLPIKALLGEALSDSEHQAALDSFYNYFDLCNEQAFLHRQKRVSDVTWGFWLDGISSNLQRPAFQRAWVEVSSRATRDFSELRRLVDSGELRALPPRGVSLRPEGSDAAPAENTA